MGPSIHTAVHTHAGERRRNVATNLPFGRAQHADGGRQECLAFLQRGRGATYVA